MQKKNLRIDYSKYQVDEVVETISDAIFFPLYIGKVLGVVVLFAGLLFLVLSYFFTSYVLTGILFFIIAYVISLPSIVIVSAIRLINTIRDDLNKIMDITIETTKHVYEDMGLLREQRESGVALKSSFNDVFRGVALYVIRPSLKKVLERRIRFFALPFTFLIDRIFRLVFIKRQPEFEVHVAPNEHLEVTIAGKGTDTRIKEGSSKFTTFALGIVKWPLYIALFIYGTVNMLLVLFFGWLF